MLLIAAQVHVDRVLHGTYRLGNLTRFIPTPDFRLCSGNSTIQPRPFTNSACFKTGARPSAESFGERCPLPRYPGRSLEVWPGKRSGRKTGFGSDYQGNRNSDD